MNSDDDDYDGPAVFCGYEALGSGYCRLLLSIADVALGVMCHSSARKGKVGMISWRSMLHEIYKGLRCDAPITE